MYMFYDRFKALCENKKISPTRAAIDMGFSNSITTKWKKTGATPDGVTLAKIAEYFGITVDELFGKEKQPADGELSDDEKAMLDLFRRASEDSRRLALLALEHGEQH